MAVVLVVDDEDVLVEMIASLVEDLGHTPVVATNGREALELLRRGPPPTLIISDLMMPKMNGAELTSAIRGDRALSHIPIILMSAALRSQDQIPADRFIHKPFDLNALTELIEQFIAV